eukprot:m.39064 g.39064  ORF g.39064 m.39064 type:complete len:591 (+) comp11232_c1_seq1:1993-3765(+)
MLDAKRRVPLINLDHFVKPVLCVLFVNLHAKGGVRGLGKGALRVQDGKDAQGLVKKHGEQGSVVGKRHGLAVNALALVLLQLELERVLVEEKLKVFVRHVDANLLKAVVGKVLKPKNVKHPNLIRRRRDGDGSTTVGALDGVQAGSKHLVGLGDNVQEQTRIQSLRKRVTRIVSLFRLVVALNVLAAQDAVGDKEGVLQSRGVRVEHDSSVSECRFRKALAHVSSLGAIKLNVAQMDDRSKDQMQCFLFLGVESNDFHGLDELLVHGLVVRPEVALDRPKLLGGGEVVLFLAGRVKDVVKAVKAPLTICLFDDARLFQQVRGKLHTKDFAFLVKQQARVLAKPTGVVVQDRLCVAKRLQQRAHLDDAVLEGATLLASAAQLKDLLDGKLGRFRFASTALTTDDAALTLLHLENVVVAHVGHAVDVRGQLATHMVIVLGHHLWTVDAQLLKGVDGNQNVADVRVDVVLAVADLELVEQRVLVEVDKRCNIVNLALNMIWGCRVQAIVCRGGRGGLGCGCNRLGHWWVCCDGRCLGIRHVSCGQRQRDVDDVVVVVCAWKVLRVVLRQPLTSSVSTHNEKMIVYVCSNTRCC